VTRVVLRAAAVVAFAVMGTATGVAHEHATGIVKERMDMMEAMAKRMKAINDRIRAKRDLAAIKTEALALQALAPHVTHLYPPGSTQAPTDAKLEIWRNWPDFEAKAKALETASADLANANPKDFDALFAQVRAVSQTCTGCHELYRAKR
jgi:cytochrome c556